MEVRTIFQGLHVCGEVVPEVGMPARVESVEVLVNGHHDITDWLTEEALRKCEEALVCEYQNQGI